MYGLVPFRGPLLLLVFLSFFSDLHVGLLFYDFTMGVLQSLNVAPSQLHPNTWASYKTFRLICDMFRLSPTPYTFLSYYTSHLAEPVSWHSFISRPDNILFSLFTISYKNFKGKFFKIFVEPEDTRFFFDKVGRSRFPLYWTRNPTRFKELTCPAPSA